MNIYACDELKITCNVICRTDGDEAGFVIGKDCFCANKRNLSHIVVKVPKNGRAIIDKTKSYGDY